MMMADSGQLVGTLSGGCLEGDLYQYAQEAMKTGQATVRHYDLTEDDVWGLGIGCKGQIEVLVEPVSMQHPFWKAFQQALESDRPFGLAVELAGRERILFLDHQMVTFSGEPANNEGLVHENIYGRAVIRGAWLLDSLTPPERLILAGAGHDAKPLSALAQQAGFEVIILDTRAMFNNARVFPQAAQWILSHPRDISGDAFPGAYWVIMNHHQERDEQALKLAMLSAPRYLGVLGPYDRTLEMLSHIGRDSETQAASLPFFSPVGLDLGAETPEEVAVSIVAEMMALREKASGGHLRGKNRIHPV
jgi:xanthine/CO dehydrogenase XdhC/CoxF family maturation factor